MVGDWLQAHGKRKSPIKSSEPKQKKNKKIKKNKKRNVKTPHFSATDKHIQLAQQLLKMQFLYLDGLQLTLGDAVTMLNFNQA